MFHCKRIADGLDYGNKNSIFGGSIGFGRFEFHTDSL